MTFKPVHSSDDEYKESFGTYWQAKRAARPDQEIYRRESDGRYCLARHPKSRRKRKYNRMRTKQLARMIIDNEVGTNDKRR